MSIQNRKINVYILEDDEDHAELIMRSFMGDSSFITHHLQKLSDFETVNINGSNNLFLFDLILPDGNSLDLIRKHNLTETFPVIAMTSYGDEKKAVEAMRTGVLDYIVKSDATLRAMPRISRRIWHDWQNIVARNEAEKELQRSENRYRLLAENASDIIFTSDTCQTITYISPSVTKITGRKAEEITGKKFSSLLATSSLPEGEGILNDILADDTAMTPPGDRLIELEFIGRESEPVWVEITLSQITDTNRSVTGIIGVARNISRRKSAEKKLIENEKKYRQVFENASDAIFLIDFETGTILDCNRAACDLLKVEGHEIKGRLYSEVLSGPAQRPLFRHKTGDTRNVPGESFMSIYNKLGDEIYLNVRTTVIEIDGGEVVHAICHDITSQKKIESQLIHAKNSAEMANRAKSVFLANMSHEIRTPLNGIMGMTELALPEETNEHQIERLEAIKHSAHSLLGIINDILDISKIEADKLELEETEYNFAELLESVLRITAVRAHEKGLELICDYDVEMPKIFRGDPLRIRQILLNLVGNAIKFTEKGEILVKVWSRFEKSRPATINISVKDSGIGIASDDAIKIFDAFQQIDCSTSRRFGGTGLGLAIARRLINMMGGEISVESIPGKGSTFTMLLPAEKQNFNKSKAACGSLPPFKRNLSFLIISPNATTKKIISRCLRLWGSREIHVAVPSRASASFSRLIKTKRVPDVIIVDAEMTEIIDISLAEELISQNPASRNSFIFMSTVRDHRRNHDSYHSTQSWPHVLKPLMPHHLYNAIASIIEERPRSVPAEMVSPGRNTASACAPASYSILLAEDNDINRNLAQQLLKKKGWDVITVENGMMALDTVKQNEFDLILMDIQMPVMDGIEATEQIRKYEENAGKYTPIVAMTAHAMKGDRERCINAGMDDYIPKPINPPEMFKIIEQAVSTGKNTLKNIKAES